MFKELCVKKRSLLMLLCLSFWLGLSPLSAQFAGGTGSAQDPYQVATAEDLNNVRNFPDACFVQTQDLDLRQAPWNQGNGWQPICPEYYAPFRGVYDGGGYNITGLYIFRPASYQQGLFGFLEGTIKNLSLSQVNIHAYHHTGALAGTSNSGNITNCSVKSGEIIGSYNTGGLVGRNILGHISLSYSQAGISGDDYTGGITAYNSGDITNCYSMSNLYALSFTGGLVGINYGVIDFCYSSGELNSDGENCGGLIGKHYHGSIENSYWDVETSGYDYSDGGEGRLTSELLYPHSANSFVGWDWEIWKPDLDHSQNQGYPFIREHSEGPGQIPYPAFCLEPLDGASSVWPEQVLRWREVVNSAYTNYPTGFKLYFGTNYPPTNILDGLDLGYQLHHQPQPHLALGTTYYWQIVPYNTYGEAENCPIWSFDTFGLSAPNGGENWQAGTTRTIFWAENAPPEDFELHISFDGGSQWNFINTVSGGRGYYHYQVPPVHSNACLVKLQSVSNSAIHDISAQPFSIENHLNLPRVLLHYPNEENIQLKAGDSVELSWNRRNLEGISLDFSLDDGLSWQEIVSDLHTDSYTWDVPFSLSQECRIRIRSDQFPQVMDISAACFSISDLQITYPAGGESFFSDYSESFAITINWNAMGMDSLSLLYSHDDGESWSVIADTLDAEHGEYEWNLPGRPAKNYRIKLSSPANPSINAISEAFTLQNPIRLQNANGGAFITDNSLFNIRWQSFDIAASSQIFWEYSLDDASWQRINQASVPASSQAMYWYVNIGVADSLWLRAEEENTGNIIAKSESSLHITDEELVIYEPNGGEIYPAQSLQNIQWRCAGLGYLNIYLSTDDGESWQLVADRVPAMDENYIWLVPETFSASCRLRLQDTELPWMRQESDLPFSIVPDGYSEAGFEYRPVSLGFGNVFQGESSALLAINLTNTSLMPLLITAASFQTDASPFALVDTGFPYSIEPADSLQIWIVFSPQKVGIASDLISIYSTNGEQALFAVPLSGMGEQIPPAPVDGIQLRIVGDDVHLSWEPVRRSISGTPVEPQGYLVYISDELAGEENTFHLQAFVPGTSFVHRSIGQNKRQQFYRIVTVVKNSGESLENTDISK